MAVCPGVLSTHPIRTGIELRPASASPAGLDFEVIIEFLFSSVAAPELHAKAYARVDDQAFAERRRRSESGHHSNAIEGIHQP